jgi:hypothetical protein
MDFWRQWTGRPAAVARMTRVKFHQFLRPGDPFCVVLAEKNGTVRFRMFHDQVQYSSGTLVLRT